MIIITNKALATQPKRMTMNRVSARSRRFSYRKITTSTDCNPSSNSFYHQHSPRSIEIALETRTRATATTAAATRCRVAGFDLSFAAAASTDSHVVAATAAATTIAAAAAAAAATTACSSNPVTAAATDQSTAATYSLKAATTTGVGPGPGPTTIALADDIVICNACASFRHWWSHRLRSFP